MRPRYRARLLPRPLLLLLAAVAVLGLAWSLLVPPWQSPDENSHFGYVQTTVERLELPGTDPGRLFSTEQDTAALAVPSGVLTRNLSAKPAWSERLYEDWQKLEFSDAERGDGGRRLPDGTANPARTNPPLYYAWESVPYVAASGGDVFSRLYLMRIWSSLLMLVAVTATWLLIGELLGRRPLLQLSGAALVGLQPMALFISSSVNPDSLLIAATAVVLWLGVRVLVRGLTPALGAALCAALAVAILTKGTAYAFVPAVLLALGVGLARLAPGRSRRLAAAVPALALAAPVGLWLVLARLADRPAVNQVGGHVTYAGPDLPGPLGYLWQFYLPKLPFGAPLPGSFPSLPATEYWLRGGSANFGWLEVHFPDPVYVAIGAVTALIVVAGGMALARRAERRHLPLLAFGALAVAGLVGGLHATEFRVMRDQGTPFVQGRYLLPLLPLLGLLAASGLTLLRERRRALAVGAFLGGLFALQLFSLGLVAARFHA